MALQFRRGTTAQKSGSLAFGEPYVNTTLGTLQVGGPDGDITLGSTGTGSTGVFGAISGSGLDITGNANIGGNLTVGGQLQIGDATSDTVNVVASLSSSLIPETTNAFDLGSANKIWRDLYISTGSIKFVDGTTVVKSLTLNTLTALEAATGSANQSVINLNSATASLNTFSGSQLTQNSALATITGSLISTASNHEQRIAANESVSSSYARTNSANTFNGTQTVSGSLYVTQDLVVGGSSSIQNISSSNLVIGTAYVTLNTATPSSRYAGLLIVDSGSAGGSGSFLYDAIQDEFVFVHRGNGTNVTSSHFVMGPETIDNLGNETYLTNNRLPKGTGKEHIVDSNITDDGTTISLGSNVNITGSLRANGINGVIITDAGIRIKEGVQTTQTGYLGVGADFDRVVLSTSGGAYPNHFIFPNNSVGGRLYTFPTVDGTIALTSDLTSGTTSVSNLNTFSASALTRLTALEVETSNLETFTASLSTTSNVRFGSLGIGMAASGTSGRIDAANDVVAFSTSDIRLKENITPIPNAIDKITKISGNTYDWKSELKDVHGYEGNDVGVIAQEVEAVLPQLVQDRDNGYKAVKYDKLVALLIEGIKEQQSQIHNLTLEVENLKKQRGL